jgi:hypothetical protein
MKRSLKLFSTLLIIVAIAMLFSITAFAESTEHAEEVEKLPSVTFQYTSDSVSKDCLTYKVYLDDTSNTTYLEIIPDLGIGYALYDNPDTEIIDGIRINGLETTSLKVPIADNVSEIQVSARTVYRDGASGDIAKILDGTYDYSELLDSPFVVLQAIYWGFMALTGIAGFIIIIRSKGKNIKTADEIAAKVTEKVSEFEQRLIEIVTNIVKAEILPLAQASVKSGKEAVKAIVLSTSKSKEAPSALLDVFKESSSIDIANIVDEVCEELSKAVEVDCERHSKNAIALHNIANNVIQEDVNDANETKTELVENKTQKSLF